MANVNQPFLYEADRMGSGFPEKPFDPKAVTRASWEPKPVKQKSNGPLLDVHPDAHDTITGRRRPYKSMSRRTRSIIKAIRVVQLCIRALQFFGAAGLLILMILLTNVANLTAWVMRITTCVVMSHCIYAIYHLSKPAGHRPPASSAAYQVFSGFSDLCALPLYAYGMLAVRNNSDTWTTMLHDTAALPGLKLAFYYTLIGAGSLHVVTLATSFWLAIKFRQITLMPPDMNPLEDHLTTRRVQSSKHWRNKSSIVTTGSSMTNITEKEKDLVRPPSVPFSHTRVGSGPDSPGRDSASVCTRDSRLNLPSRQYQIQVNSKNNSPRNSMPVLKRASGMGTGAGTPPSSRGMYAELSLHESYYGQAPSGRPRSHRPSKSVGADSASTKGAESVQSKERQPAEGWYASDSLASRTQQRNQALNTLVMNASGMRRDYNPVNQNFDFPDSDNEGSDSETLYTRTGGEQYVLDDSHRYENFRFETNVLSGSQNGNGSGSGSGSGNNSNNNSPHPDPLHSNPMATRVKSMPAPGRPVSAALTVSSMTSAVSSRSSISVTRDQAVTGDLADGDNDDDDYVVKSPTTGRALTGSGIVAAARRQFSGKAREANEAKEAEGKYKDVKETNNKKRWTWGPKSHDSEQTREGNSPKSPKVGSSGDSGYSKPYGALKASTPPIVVGKDMSSVPAGRQVSSGNDYDLGNGDSRYLFYSSEAKTTFGRRHVSGKLAEEGRAYSRYSALND